MQDKIFNIVHFTGLNAFYDDGIFIAEKLKAAFLKQYKEKS